MAMQWTDVDDDLLNALYREYERSRALQAEVDRYQRLFIVGIVCLLAVVFSR